MKKNDKKVTHKRKAPVRGIDPLRAGAAKGMSVRKIDYTTTLPQMFVSEVCELVALKDNPKANKFSRIEAYMKLEEICRRCNQFIPQVMRYKRLLDQLGREVSPRVIAEKKAGGKSIDARKIAKTVCDSEWRCPINEAGAECDCCVGRGKNCPLERSIELFNDESGAKVGRK